MFLLRLLRPRPSAEDAEQATFSALHKLAERSAAAGFREFTVPRQKQGGGVMQWGRRGQGKRRPNGIIPSAGGKVP